MALGNGGRGIQISAGSQGNRIGTDGNGLADVDERNVISGNIANGILMGNVGTE